jgi:hypothetical protein
MNKRLETAVKKGRGLLMVYTDVGPEHEDEFNRWYNEEHIPERLSIPGVLSAARYTAVQGSPKYLACYELADPEAWRSEAWQYWLNNPTEWSQRMSPSVIGINYIRNLYRLIYPAGVPGETAQAEMAPVLLVGRMSVPPDLDDEFNQAYNTERLPLCYDVPGYIRGRRFQAVMGEPKYTTLHEMESLQVSASSEWEAWRRTETPLWNGTVRAQMTHAPGSPGIYQRIFP